MTTNFAGSQTLNNMFQNPIIQLNILLENRTISSKGEVFESNHHYKDIVFIDFYSSFDLKKKKIKPKIVNDNSTKVPTVSIDSTCLKSQLNPFDLHQSAHNNNGTVQIFFLSKRNRLFFYTKYFKNVQTYFSQVAIEPR